MLHHFDSSRLAASAWKNGGGVTQEIVRWPLGSTLEDFAWRASIAGINADGDFSPFPGVDRHIVMLDGAGVCLYGADGGLRHRLDQAFAPYAFSGDEPLKARLIGGACRDFNIMTRQGGPQASVSVLRGRTVLAPAGTGLVYAASGQWDLESDSGACLLQKGAGFWWVSSPQAWTAAPREGQAVLLAVAWA